MMTATTDRIVGALIGLAVGDALGASLEFKRPGSFAPLTDMVGGGPFGLKPGEWTDDFASAVLAAANLGDDADTTAAVCGQIAGAHYGASAIPDRWRSKLAKRELIESLAERLARFSPAD